MELTREQISGLSSQTTVYIASFFEAQEEISSCASKIFFLRLPFERKAHAPFAISRALLSFFDRDNLKVFIQFKPLNSCRSHL
ncbi:MAG: hypothetical protein SOY99_00935 [Alloprevotella sp.]|nr:hypothetical protein [Alloprevotella sp.]